LQYEAEISELRNVKAQAGAIMFSGFPGPGLVGQIAASEMAQQLKLAEVAHLKSSLLPPMAVFIRGVLRFPIRIYANDLQSIFVAVSDVPVPSRALYHVGGKLVEWASERGIDELVCLEGIPTDEKFEPLKVCGVAEPEVLEQLKMNDIQCHNAGYVAGVSGVVLNECLERKIKGLCLLVPAAPKVPDPQSAAILLERVNAIYSLTIDVSSLLAQIGLFKSQMKDVAESVRKVAESDSEDRRMYA
jgi:uncharacterized protein